MYKSLPAFFKTTLALLCIFWLTLALGRVAMLFILWPDLSSIPASVVAKALYIGLKFDGRIAVFMLIPLAIILGLPFLENHIAKMRKALACFYALIFFIIGNIYVLDFGFYFYLNQRLDATVIDLLLESTLSLNMVLETYPVVWITIAVLLFAGFGYMVVYKILGWHQPTAIGWKKRTGFGLLSFILLFLVAYAQLSTNLFPLRWSNAYFHTSPQVPLLALNPLQNLVDSIRSRKAIAPDMQAVEDAYPRMKAWLGVPDDAPNLSFLRFTPAKENQNKPPLNVVIIIMESLGTPRTSLWEGLDTEVTYDPTPNVRRITKESLYFPWFFAPARTTARAVFTFVSGIPDVNRTTGTTSRNLTLVDQFSVMSQFEGYEKSYMLGGNANWANIRGVLTYNVPGLKLLEEGHWKASNVDVWGISDLDLFREGVEYLNQEQEPFISVIQTASFHRPWTIPADNAGFTTTSVPREILDYYGFVAQEEYDSMRFSDHALGEFFRLGKDQPWFENTVFVIFGDHGLTATSTNATAAYLNSNLQGSHVPLLLYAPGRPDLFQPGINPMPSGNTDVLPTMASLAGIAYYNNTTGRNLFDPHSQETAMQFIAGDDEAFRKLVADGYAYVLTEKEGLFRLDDATGTNLIDIEPERAARMRQAAKDFFVTSKYMLFNNKKSSVPALEK